MSRTLTPYTPARKQRGPLPFRAVFTIAAVLGTAAIGAASVVEMLFR